MDMSQCATFQYPPRNWWLKSPYPLVNFDVLLWKMAHRNSLFTCPSMVLFQFAKCSPKRLPSSSEAHRPKTLTANQLIFQQVEEDGSDGSCMTNQSRVHLGRPLDFPVVLQLPLLFFTTCKLAFWGD